MSEPKWCCSFCTYQNWPAASTCALCRNSCEAAVAGVSSSSALDIENDIYKLAIDDREAGRESDPAGTCESAESELSETQKWSCAACTYLNWPKSQHCVQCRTPKPEGELSSAEQKQQIVTDEQSTNEAPKLFELDTNANVTEQQKLKKVVKVRTECETPKSAVGKSQMVEAQEQQIETAESGKKVQLSNGTEAETEAEMRDTVARLTSQKWSCRVCAFDNCSSSGRCVVCGNSRPAKCNAGSPVQSQAASLISATGDCELPAASSASSTANSNTSSRINSRAQSPCSAQPAVKKGACEKPAVRCKVRGLRPRAEGAAAGASATGRRLPCAVAGASEYVDELNRLLLACIGVRNTVSVNVVRLRTSQGGAGGDFELPFPCYYVGYEGTFTLPPAVYTMPFTLQSQLLRAVVDGDALAALEADAVVNWSLELVDCLQSRLYALANRTSGDCLLDSVLQATWGVCDREAILRRLLYESLVSCSELFFIAWKRYELERQRRAGLIYSLSDAQWRADWRELLELAAKPGSSLEQLHVLALAHIFRRPIIVYSVRFVTGLRGDPLAASPFQGVYLPVFWERVFCSRSPIALGYTRGHFSALVAIEPSGPAPVVPPAAAARPRDESASAACVYYPLVDRDGSPLPIHFSTPSMAAEPSASGDLDDGARAAGNTHVDLATLCEWLDCVETPSGLLVARCRLQPRLAQVRDMCQNWLDSFRRPTEPIEPAVRKVPRTNAAAKEALVSPQSRKPPSPTQPIEERAEAVLQRNPVASLPEDDI